VTGSEKAEGDDFPVSIVPSDVGAISLEEKDRGVNKPRNVSTNIR
jgi:hypothetical protein